MWHFYKYFNAEWAYISLFEVCGYFYADFILHNIVIFNTIISYFSFFIILYLYILVLGWPMLVLYNLYHTSQCIVTMYTGSLTTRWPQSVRIIQADQGLSPKRVKIGVLQGPKGPHNLSLIWPAYNSQSVPAKLYFTLHRWYTDGVVLKVHVHIRRLNHNIHTEHLYRSRHAVHSSRTVV